MPLRTYQPQKSGFKLSKDGMIKLDFNETDLRTVLVFLSELTGETLILDRCVKGPVTVISPLPVSRDEAIKIIYSALEMNKFTIVRNGKIAKVIRSGDAKQSPITLSSNRMKDKDVNDLVRAQVISPKNISASNLKRFLDPMMSKGCGQVLHNKNANNLILIDTGTNIKRLMEITEMIDKPVPENADNQSNRKLYTFKLKNAEGFEVKEILHSLIPGGFNIAVSDKTDTLFIMTTENIYNSILEIIEKVDVPSKFVPKNKINPKSKIEN